MPSLIIDIPSFQQVIAFSKNAALTDHRRRSNKSQNKLSAKARKDLIAEYMRCHPLVKRRG